MRYSTGLRLQVLRARVKRRIRAALPRSRTMYVDERVEEYRRYWSAAATFLGATFDERGAGVWEVRRGRQHTRLTNYVTQCDDPVTLRLAGDKPFCYRLAIAAGVPIPDHITVTLATLSEGKRFLENVGVPVVVKPAVGSSSGLGVSTWIRTGAQLTEAAALASLFDDRILIERMIPGESYRLLYLDSRLIHAVRRRGTRVVGNGLPLTDLLRRSGQGSLGGDPLVRQTLAAQGLTLDTVTRPGAEILVRGLPANAKTQELRTVYDESVLSRCGADLIGEGAAVVKALGSEFAGVDVITADPSVSLRASGGAFIEINTTPGIHHHYVDTPCAQTAPVAVTVLEYLLTRKGGC